MVDFGVKQGCPLPPTLLGLYIDEFDTYLDKINGDSLCLFKMIVAILLYADDVVMIFKSKACLQRLLNKLHKFCTSSSLDVDLIKTNS
jgi:hypothetical protein